MVRYLWTCPFCGRGATITDSDHQEDYSRLSLDNAHGLRELRGVFVVCPNPECREFTLTANLYEVPRERREWTLGPLLNTWRLIPPSQAKVFPEYVPQAIRADYQEACLILDLSPKASATLSRRCLQGMIRHFWKVKGNNLKEEIEAIKDEVEPLTWDAIDSVRNVGNIGAHMEKDINLIIDVEPEEAGLLIWLIEHLVKDWYINRHEREERLRALKGVGDAKTKVKGPPAAAPQTEAPPA
jgi:hypothetical protein